ncbi:MAG TPA: hypothetical protein VGF45_09665 [Polyangia bacterium]
MRRALIAPIALAAVGLATAACSSEALSEEAKRASTGAFVRLEMGEGGFCRKRLSPCATTTVVTPMPPQIIHGPFGEPGAAKPLTEVELSRVTAVVDSYSFRLLMAGNRDQCNQVPDASVTLMFATDLWTGRDGSASGCIIDNGNNPAPHPYRSLHRVVTALRDAHFDKTPDPGPLAACLINKGDAEICETYVESECLALGGIVRRDGKCIDGKLLP